MRPKSNGGVFIHIGFDAQTDDNKDTIPMIYNKNNLTFQTTGKMESSLIDRSVHNWSLCNWIPYIINTDSVT